jgi:proline iminopeptidase
MAIALKALTASLALVLAACAVYTQPFTDETGRLLPGSIAEMQSVTIGGVPQSIWFRAANAANPALILLHGGPGASESALFRRFNAGLERNYLVVYWEQRGTGRSYHPDIPPESMTIEQLVRDLDEVVEVVRGRFGKRKVVLLGHSWGTVLGTIYAHRHPEKVSAYVGVAQIADMERGAILSRSFALSEAIRRGNHRAIEELRRIGPVPRSADERLALGKWVERFGGTFRGRLSTGRLILAALGTDEANLLDLVRFGQGNRFSLERLEHETARLDLTGAYRTFRVPVFFLLGRHDMQVPAFLAAEYFELIEAPYKRLVWFEQSAHNPPFEEPENFNAVLTEQVLPVLNGP